MNGVALWLMFAVDGEPVEAAGALGRLWEMWQTARKDRTRKSRKQSPVFEFGMQSRVRRHTLRCKNWSLVTLQTVNSLLNTEAVDSDQNPCWRNLVGVQCRTLLQAIPKHRRGFWSRRYRFHSERWKVRFHPRVAYLSVQSADICG